MIRTDITRINGTYWNLNGFWRAASITNRMRTGNIQDLINRTYTIASRMTIPTRDGLRLRATLPAWATSLDTIDGGYVGRRLTRT